MFDRVLILSVGLGGGHLRAAQAIEAAFRRLGGAREVRSADAMQYGNKLFHKLFLRAYADVIQNAPEVYGWLYDHFDKPWSNRGHRNIFEKLNTRPVLRLLDEYRPDLVICTHVLPAGILSWLKEKHHIYTPQVIVITDFDVHALWLCDCYEHYFVALDETKLHLEALGVPANRVTATGIPIDPVFGEDLDKAEARRQLGLDPDLTVILVTGGSWGLGPIDRLVQSLEGLDSRVQVVAICGRNEPLKATMDRLVSEREAGGPVSIVSVGWTDRMQVFMSAADLHAGKTGGLTTSEALAKGLPMLVVNPIQGQEERNADHLLEECVAIRCNNLPVLACKVDRLLGSSRRLARMGANARRLGRPDAALSIVRKLLQLQRRGFSSSCAARQAARVTGRR